MQCGVLCSSTGPNERLGGSLRCCLKSAEQSPGGLTERCDQRSGLATRTVFYSASRHEHELHRLEAVRHADTMRNAQFTEQSLQSMLDRMGINVPLVGDFHFNGHRLLSQHPACAEALAKLEAALKA